MTDVARCLISTLAANSQHLGTMTNNPKKVNEVSTSNPEHQIFYLTLLVRQLVVGNAQAIKVCGICSVGRHLMDMCPTLQDEGQVLQANAIGDFLGQP